MILSGADVVGQAAALIGAGEVVAIPTETVYGLAADATNAEAVAKIYARKGRPAVNPLIVHVLDANSAERFGWLDDRARAAMAAFWPGPLTLVVPLRVGSGLALAVTAGLPTVALRSPAHPLARALLEACGRPLAAPSANRSGTLSPTRAAHVVGGYDDGGPPVLDGGPCAVGLESTIVDLTGPPRILRPGALGQAELEPVLGPVLPFDPDSHDDLAPMAPGMMFRHYAPNQPLRLGAVAPRGGEGWLSFGPGSPGVTHEYALSTRSDLREAAQRLFEGLWVLDHSGCEGIAVAPIPEEELGVAIMDRLRRAARG